MFLMSWPLLISLTSLMVSFWLAGLLRFVLKGEEISKCCSVTSAALISRGTQECWLVEPARFHFLRDFLVDFLVLVHSIQLLLDLLTTPHVAIRAPVSPWTVFINGVSSVIMRGLLLPSWISFFLNFQQPAHVACLFLRLSSGPATLLKYESDFERLAR